MDRTGRHWLPGLSAAAVKISQPRDAGTLSLVSWILLLLPLMFVPSIIDNIYLIVRRGVRRSHPGRTPE